MNDVLRESYSYDNESWIAWPVNWSAICVGALTALAVALVIGLTGVAIGAHVLQTDPWVETNKIGWGTVISAILGAFLAFAAGGWVAGRIAGIRRSEPAMLHGAIVWLTAIPALVLFAAIGAGSYFGSWYGGLSGQPAWVQADPAPGPNATTTEREAYESQLAQSRRAARNSALGAVTALLLGLMGSVVGGWMASGEPMTLTHHRTRLRSTSTAVPAGTT